MPTGQALQEAVQNPKLNFADTELQQGQPVLNELGLPKPISGNFSSVFGLDCPGGKRYAVKCFFNDLEDLHDRYDAIHSYLEAVQYPWEVDFAYLTSGVLVAGAWHPIVKMEWFEGVRLDRYVQQHLGQPRLILNVAEKFVAAVRTLNESGAAHGDLQHGNILVSESGDLRLVDYDGMYVPGLAGRKSHEIGHPNYQHPGRTEDDFGPYLDNFPAWVIYLSLLAVAVDPTVWIRVQGGDDALVFKRQDFGGGIFSSGFAAVEATGSDRLKELAAQLRSMVDLELADVPSLTPVEVEVADLELSGAAFSLSSSTSLGTPTGAPEWIGAPVGTEQSAPAGLEWMVEHLGELMPVQPTFRVALARTIIALAGCCIAAAFIGLALGVPITAALTVLVGTVVLAVITLTAAYGRSADVKRKRRLRGDTSSERKSTRKSASLVDDLVKKRMKNDEVDQKKRADIQRRQQKVVQGEQKALSDAEQRMQNRLRKLAEKRASLVAEEQRERARTLTQLQNSFVQSQLGNYPIHGASISGIGPSLTATLAAYGFRTAADVVNFSYGSDEVSLVHSSGRHVHVHGIGEQRALSLIVWRNGVESRVRAGAPQSLPAAQSQQIHGKYADKVNEVGIEEGQARRVAQQEADQIRATSQEKQGKLVVELRDASSAAAQVRSELDLRLSDARREHNVTQWAFATKEREARSYRDVTFRRFLAATFVIARS